MAVETRTSEVATYVTQKQIEALPQGSRNFLAFADTVPGMLFSTSNNGESQLRSGAQGANNINVYIDRSEEHTSELQYLMRISYAVFCFKKKNRKQQERQ